MNEALRAQHELHKARRARLGAVYAEVLSRTVVEKETPPQTPKVYVNDVIIDPSAQTVLSIYSPSLRKIAKLVSEFYDIPIIELLGRRRTKELIEPRQICFYLCKTCTPKSFPEIGRTLGDFDHTTILHGFRKIEKLRKTNQRIDTLCRELESNFRVVTATHVYWGA